MPPLPSALLKTAVLTFFFCECAPVCKIKKKEEVKAGIHLLDVEWIKFTQPSLDFGKINTLTVLDCALMTTQVRIVQKKVWFFFPLCLTLIMQGCLHLFIMPFMLCLFLLCVLCFIFEAFLRENRASKKSFFLLFQSSPTVKFRILARYCWCAFAKITQTSKMMLHQKPATLKPHSCQVYMHCVCEAHKI